MLDFGCGTGLLSERVSPQVASIVALDPAQKMISALDAKQLANVSTLATSLDQTLVDNEPLLSGRFDLIMASSALAFVEDYPATLSLLKQLLADGGQLIQWDWLKAEGAPGAGFSHHQMMSAFEAAGFDDVAVSLPFSMHSEQGDMDVLMGVGKCG